MTNPIDINELVGRLRYLRDRNVGTFVGDMFGDAAHALEMLAGENERLRRQLDVTTDEAVKAENESAELKAEVGAALLRAFKAEARLAKLAPIVEAARAALAMASELPTWVCAVDRHLMDAPILDGDVGHIRLDRVQMAANAAKDALANLEAANDQA